MAESTAPARGKLRVFLGAAPGVGKTYAMLGEARRRLERGTDVVVGYVETHGRQHTAAMLEGLEVLPRIRRVHRGATFEEMDLDGVLRRAPAVVLVDELAHTNVPGGRHPKRWQDVEELLAAGIDVVTTLNVQHLESLTDVVEKITGVTQQETIPDSVVRAADQIELRDMAGEAIRRRLAHGNVYAPEKIDAALGNYFRLGNLTALRELALLWTADRVDDALQVYRDQHDIRSTWEARERVVVALTGGPEGETVVRRAARIATRAGGELLAVHVTRSDGLAGVDPAALAAQRRLVESLGGTYHQVLGSLGSTSVSDSLLAFARAENATQLVLGDSRRSRLAALLTGPGIGTRTIRYSGDIDVHMVTHHAASGGRGRIGPGHPARSDHADGRRNGRRRLLVGLVVALALPCLIAVVLVPLRGQVNLVGDMLLFLLGTVGVALVGGTGPALVAAVLGSMLLNYYFTPPLHTLDIREADNVLALIVFVAVAMVVSTVVDTSARRSREAARSAAEARTLADLASAALRGGDVVELVLERLRETFALESVTLFRRVDGAWHPVSCAGGRCAAPDESQTQVPAGRDLVLGLRGRLLEAEDQRLVSAFAAQVASLVERRALEESAATASTLAEVDQMRTALLAAVGHDLRTPLAAATASVAGLRSEDVTLSPHDRDELLDTAGESLARLASLVDNLLDMSRLQVGALSVSVVPTAVEEVVARALDDLGPSGRTVRVDVPPDLVLVRADPGLLERVLANVLVNAVRHSPPDRPASITASRLTLASGDRVEVRVVDRGPGVAAQDVERIFAPFQRLGDHDNTTGIGLGLALARGLAEGMGGSLEPQETPGGGLTMVLSLEVSGEAPTLQPGRRERAEGLT